MNGWMWFLYGLLVGGAAVAGWVSEARKDGMNLWQEVKARFRGPSR